MVTWYEVCLRSYVTHKILYGNDGYGKVKEVQRSFIIHSFFLNDFSKRRRLVNSTWDFFDACFKRNLLEVCSEMVWTIYLYSRQWPIFGPTEFSFYVLLSSSQTDHHVFLFFPLQKHYCSRLHWEIILNRHTACKKWMLQQVAARLFWLQQRMATFKIFVILVWPMTLALL